VNDSNLHEELHALAGRHTPRAIDLDQVRLQVSRRRTTVRSARSGVALLATASVIIGVHVADARPDSALLVPGKGGPPAPTAASTLIASPDVSGPSAATTSAPVEKTPPPRSRVNTPGVEPSTVAAVASGLRPLACGSRIERPIDAGDTYGTLTFAVTSVPGTAGGPPQVTYRVTSTTTSTQTREPGTPRVLILHSGAVVAGQDDAYSHSGVNNPKTADSVTISPAHPHTAVLPPLPGQPCAGLNWSQVTNSTAGYRVALIIMDRDTVYTPSPPPATPFVPVLVVQAPAGG